MKTISGYEGEYFLTENQEIYSVKSGKIIKIQDCNGYNLVSLWKNNIEKKHFVHVLVAKAFPEICGEWFEGCDVHHIDFNRKNNNPHNLLVMPQKEHKALHANCDETRKKLRYSHKGQIAWNKGKHSKSGMEGKQHSETSIEKMRTNSQLKKSVQQIDMDGKIVCIFQSSQEASRATGIDGGNIRACCNNKPHHLTAGGYKWKWVS